MATRTEFDGVPVFNKEGKLYWHCLGESPDISMD